MKIFLTLALVSFPALADTCSDLTAAMYRRIDRQPMPAIVLDMDAKVIEEKRLCGEPRFWGHLGCSDRINFVTGNSLCIIILPKGLPADTREHCLVHEAMHCAGYDHHGS